MNKKLERDEQRKVIGGVCAGLAEYLSIDVTIIRILFVLSLCLHGTGFLPYLVLWIVIPRKSFQFSEPFVDYTVPPANGRRRAPFTVPQMPKQSSNTGGLIIGMILLLLGVYFLLDQFDVIPYLNFERFWPLILVAIGGVLILKGSTEAAAKKQAWDSMNEQPKDEPINFSTDNETNTNPPTI